ncbi:hypothetical protein DCAR_0727782 [Daucus carota subsp. sativus]|uniref:Replication protein A OB domain-containing protein n=1 Tax=Daucus carota subsp. sativus TaxID=79200 RepID=A0A161ZLM1_DAUCS|nr:hypothetical protein DCAR_0727782 [Daucus carota subsp. sativus]
MRFYHYSDVVGVIDGQPVKNNYNKGDVDRSMVKFGVTDGKYYAIVTFFNELGDTLLKALEQKLQNPVIIIIASAKISEWKDEVGLTNYPATRFYLNCKTPCCQNYPWKLVEKRFKCRKYGKFKPYLDRRYKFCMLCSNETGSIPVLWSDKELTRVTGKTVYDVLADESQENVLQGSNMYTVVTVSDAEEISSHHNPAEYISAEIKQTEISQDTNVIKSSSPPTGESTTKTRARKTTDAIELQLPQKTPHRRVKHNVRMQAFVPTFLMEKLLKIFFVGRMYTITNFQVKEYTELDKWKCVTTGKQLMFTNQTRAKEIDERKYFIPQNCFDFCDLGDVKNFVKQSTYLADVVGAVRRRDDLKIVHTKEGTDKPQIRMTISDRRTYLNVTLWNDLAECFQQEISSTKFEEPMIVIIAVGKVGVFQDEFDICNFSPTTYYINYDHHSVAELRKV